MQELQEEVIHHTAYQEVQKGQLLTDLLTQGRQPQQKPTAKAHTQGLLQGEYIQRPAAAVIHLPEDHQQEGPQIVKLHTGPDHRGPLHILHPPTQQEVQEAGAAVSPHLQEAPEVQEAALAPRLLQVHREEEAAAGLQAAQQGEAEDNILWL